jgi:uncharacterized protein YceH (UPF0502 family)
MLELTPDECRVLGCLVEKAMTTPGQYPLTLNALVAACSQKSNRDPVEDYDEDRVLDAVDGLRRKGLVREAMLSGSRVTKYRHVARETIEVATCELTLLTELLLRGPQTVGELRSRAARLHEFESTDAVELSLKTLEEHTPPLAKRLAPAPGSRAPRWAQTLCATLHPLDPPAPTEARSEPAPAAADADMLDRLEKLETEVADLREQVARYLQAGERPTID